MTVLLVVGVASCFYYKNAQQKAKEKNMEESTKVWIMQMFGYLEYASNYRENPDGNTYEDFLQDENLPTLLVRIKKQMGNNYPEIGYGDKYSEITVERLKTEYMAVSDELGMLIKDFNNYPTAEISLQRDIIKPERNAMREDGIWISEGNEKVAEDSPIALTRKAKAGCMRFLYLSNYESNFLWEYNDKIFENYLSNKNLSLFLDYMKEYMESNHSEIGYGSRYEEITIERLKTECETVYQELTEMNAELEEQGIIWDDISSDIRAHLEIN